MMDFHHTCMHIHSMFVKKVSFRVDLQEIIIILPGICFKVVPFN